MRGEGHAGVTAAAVARIAERTVRAMVSAHVADECWLFQGARLGPTRTGGYLKRGGYGVVKIRAVSTSPRYVHIVMYEHHVGPVPAGLELDHLCEVPHCWRPSHLEPVTHRENIVRSIERRRAAAA